jgi:LuxR family maltose regulon positive regulatory protein
MKARAHALQLKSQMRVHLIANTEAWSDYLLGCTYLHANELDAASAHFAEAASKRNVLEPKAALETLAGLALTQTLAGQTDEADDTVDRLMAYARDQGEAEIQTIVDSCRARLQVLRGKLTPAMQWARSINPTPTPDELFVWLEVPSMTRARVLVAVGSEESLEDAAAQLAAVRHQSEACHFTGQTIEAAVLQSLLREKQGRRAEALQSLQEAVALAAPGGWIRPFIESGKPVADLLGRLAKQTVVTDHLRLLVDAVARRQSQPEAAGEGWHGEPLTRRELDILELLAHRLQNKEIAARLFVSPETVKTHLKHLYQKLGVTNRREAAVKAIDVLGAARAGARGDDRMDAE